MQTMGYEVEQGGEKAAYVLTGKRGATYRLVRHTNRPELMYVTNSVGNICGLKGNYTFTDEANNLRPWYGHF